MYNPFELGKDIPAVATTVTSELSPEEIRTQELYDLLCEKIAGCTQSLAGIVEQLRGQHQGFPSIAIIYKRLREDEAFAQQYSRAKEDQADLMADQIMEIADDASNDENGNVSVQRAKLRVESRKWLSSKLKSKVYGDRTERAQINVQINNAVDPVDLSAYSL